MKISKIFISVILIVSLLVLSLPASVFAVEQRESVAFEKNIYITLSADSAGVGEEITVQVNSDAAAEGYKWCRSEKRYGGSEGSKHTYSTDCEIISDATGSSYTIQEDDLGKYIRCHVTIEGREYVSYSAFAVGNLALRATGWGYIADGDKMVTSTAMFQNGTENSIPSTIFDGEYYRVVEELVRNKNDVTRTMLIDLGSEKRFDNIFLRTMYATAYTPKYELYCADTIEALSVKSDANKVEFVSYTKMDARMGSGWHIGHDFKILPQSSRYLMITMSGVITDGSRLARVYEIEAHYSPDTVPPVISLNGKDTVTVVKRVPYIEEGFVASDASDVWEDGKLKFSYIDNSTKTATVYKINSDGERVGPALQTDVSLESISLDTSEISKYEIVYNVKDVYGNSADPVSRIVSVEAGKCKSGNLAYEKVVGASSNIGSMEFAADGNDYTSWTPDGGDSEPYVCFDLGEAKYVSNIRLNSNNVSSYSLAGSDDNTTWKPICTGTGAVLEFEPARYRYYKLSLVGSGIDLKETELYFTATGKAKVAAKSLSIATANISEDLLLPTSGLYNSTVTWSSSNENVITKDGNIVSRGSSAVLTASVKVTDTDIESDAAGIITRDFTVSIAAASTGLGGNGGNGGNSGSGGSGGGGVKLPVTDPGVSDNTTIPSDYESKPTASKPSFSDVSKSHWASEYITELASLGIISGMGDGSFAPEETVKREQLVKMIAETLGLKADGENSFDDVDESQWYGPYIAAAVASGIINGVSDNSFGIGRAVSRQDMCVIIYRAMMNISPSLFENIEPQNFADEGEIADYALLAVGSLKALGLVDGVGADMFAPTAPVTRAQAAKILYFMIEQVGSR